MNKSNALEAYILSKRLNSNDFKLSSKERALVFNEIQKIISESRNNETRKAIEIISNLDKKNAYLDVVDTLFNQNSSLALLCSLMFIMIKDEIMSNKEVFTKEYFNIIGITTDPSPHEKLNLKYDNATVLYPYANRVGLVATLYDSNFYIPQIIRKCDKLSPKTQELILILFKELLPFFQITFDESVKQSGISSSGSDYESRIENLLKSLNIKFDKHQHEEGEDSEQEHDFIFTFDDKTFGIGAKRTLRERYKQYNPKGVDIAIVFTIGQDLGLDKVERMTKNFNQKIFVADEVYQSNSFLQQNKSVFPVSKFNTETLKDFIKK